MNILFAYYHTILPKRGGTERVAYTVAHALKRCGHSVYFIATHATEKDFSDSFTSDYFFIREEESHEKRRQIIIDTCENLHIDVLINVAGESGHRNIFSNKVLPNTKIISWFHFDVYGYIKYFLRGHSPSRLKRWVLDILFRIGINVHYLKRAPIHRKRYLEVIEVSDAVVGVTPVIAQQLKQFTGSKSDKIISILNPTSFPGVRPIYDTKAKEKLLIYVGHLSLAKHVEKIIGAWARLAHKYPDWKLEIAGDGEKKESLMRMVQKRNIPRVHFHGRVSDVNSLYNRAEHLILASDSFESFGCVVIESLTYGCYPIVIDYPSAKVVIPDSHIGTRIYKRSSAALAKAIDHAISTNKSNRSNMEAVTQHLASFNIDKIAQEWQTLLTRITHQ